MHCVCISLKVCGCDGVTYSNKCDANSQGINVVKGGKCPEARTSDLLLQQALAPQPPVEYKTSTSSACSAKTVMLGSVIHNAFASKSVRKSPPRSRGLETCSYNVEVFVSGCQYFG